MKLKEKSIKNKGFTLIELLVVVAIISVLSSVVLSNVRTARLKSTDSQKKMQLDQVQKALILYHDKFGYYPPNDGPLYDEAVLFNNMAQTLVDEGFLTAVPVSPCGPTCDFNDGGYAYYNYTGTGTYNGIFLATRLDTLPCPHSCRQDVSSSALCYTTVNLSRYCLCLPN